MSKGGQTQTTTTTPPKYQQPYLEAGLARAEQMYSGNPVQTGAVTGSSGQGIAGIGRDILGRGNSSSGNYGAGQIDSTQMGTLPIAGFTPDQQAAQDMIRQRATGGDPTLKAANSYVQNSLNGGFLNANPYTDETFNRAAMATQGQLASQFAGSGRNVDASQGLRSQQLNDLASQIYGGNYANERQLMQGTLGQAQQLGNQSYIDAAALGASGGQQQAQNQTQLNAPGDALDQYLRRISGNQGSTTTQSGGSNALSGAVGGGLAGAQFGPWGSLIGAGLGGIFG